MTTRVRGRSHPQSRGVGGGASTLVVVAIAAALTACAPREAPPPAVRPVELMQVKLGSAGSTAVFAGEIRPRLENDLGFRIGGKIVARNVDVGARVKKGQVLARLDPDDVRLQAEAARAQLAATETEYAYAKAEFERYQSLLEQKFVSASALDAKRNAMNATRARYEQAKAQLAVSANQAGYATLTADHDGVITAVSAEAGQVVAAGQPVLRLAREDEPEAAIFVPENRIGELRAARELGVVLWANPARIYPARVREIAPAVDPATRTFAVRLSILERDAALQWGMTANVVLRAGGADNAALLPLTALYRRDGKPAVWIYDPATRKVTLRPVDILAYREDGVVIRAGLNTGDYVVTAGVHKLTEGQTVRPYRPNGATDAPPAAAPQPG
jgi:RND family efflux transporter MFP subunit